MKPTGSTLVNDALERYVLLRETPIAHYTHAPSIVTLTLLKDTNVRPDRVTAIVMLSHSMNSSGQLDQQSADRARLSAQLFKQQRADFMITSGWAYRADVDYSIATAVKRHLITTYELPEDRIIDEPHSRDTVGDAIFTKVNAVLAHAIDEIFVVSSSYHLVRAKVVFEFIYKDTVKLNFAGVDAPDAQDMQASERASLTAFKKTFEGIAAGADRLILERMKTSHPYYNGEIHPAIG